MLFIRFQYTHNFLKTVCIFLYRFKSIMPHISLKIKYKCSFQSGFWLIKIWPFNIAGNPQKYHQYESINWPQMLSENLICAEQKEIGNIFWSMKFQALLDKSVLMNSPMLWRFIIQTKRYEVQIALSSGLRGNTTNGF